METIYFITGNENKLKEARDILEPFKVENKVLPIPEIQGDRFDIVRTKAKFASDKFNLPVFVDDTNLCLSALSDLPGPYIDDFLKAIGREGIVKMLHGFEDKSAKAICMIAYCEPGKDPVIFEGLTEGEIVSPRGSSKFGFDPIFQPKGYKKTYAELGEKKNEISHRKLALEKLRAYLEKQG
jgi:inosine triphosphate pyrophosphatase